MIIVSQNKRNAINLDNVTVIGILEIEKKIKIAFNNKIELTIGEYKTKERAEEILEDINHYRAIFEYYKYSPDDIKDDIASKFITEDVMFDTYEMPEE